MASPSSPVFGELARLDILVAVPPDEEGTFLVRELRRTRASVRSLWPLPAPLPWVPGNARAALVGVMPAQFSGDFDLLRTSAVDAVLHRPLTAHAVMTCLIIAWMRFSYERRLRQRIAKLEETLRAVRLVERAKAILVAKRNLNEDDAYRFMQRQAMERRVPIAVIASAIIDSQAILG